MRKAHWKVATALAAAGLALTACNDEAPAPGDEPGAQAAGSVAEDCTPQHPDIETIREGALTVAQYEYPPFSMLEGETLTGVEGEILSRFAELECLEIEIVQGDSAAMITSVSTGRADTTLGSWYRTAERAEVVRLSEPVITSPLSIVSTEGIDNVDDLMEVRVGIGQGLVAVEDLQAIMGDNLNIYQNVDSVFADLQVGRIDAAVLGYGAAITQLELRPVEGAEIQPIQPDERIASTVDVGQTNFPTHLDNESLGQAIDEVLTELRESGEIEEIAVRYGFSPEVADPGEPNLL
ncbi:substrate-binding periplasmic protein [Sediminivirga luteola]|uniref:Amino acid ABC transporter n=1 Tax=Sediminivirga luteola TaxID=1774748 RepID=A0A8J2TY61_9MICO|nr:ABC transporter substrate-binding protein [Sediminivirga luteola]MCI2265851.1 ABC transporter substrate-binding protein [Sediminivirga luteola]GGA14137.1 amino acid ABC transporter [Sediminivirga luteola]